MDKNGFLIELSESDRSHFGKVDFEEQSEEQKVFSAIWELESQVNNGGFLQYLENGRTAPVNFVPTALKLIGASQCARIVERVIHVVSSGPFPTDPQEAETLVAGLSDDTKEELDSLSSEFFDYPDDLTELLFAFVSKHPKVFGPVC